MKNDILDPFDDMIDPDPIASHTLPKGAINQSAVTERYGLACAIFANRLRSYLGQEVPNKTLSTFLRCANYIDWSNHRDRLRRVDYDTHVRKRKRVVKKATMTANQYGFMIYYHDDPRKVPMVIHKKSLKAAKRVTLNVLPVPGRHIVAYSKPAFYASLF